MFFKWCMIFLVRLYQKYISPRRMPVCRFLPSCSSYALVALKHHNLLQAMWLIFVRLLKCTPFHSGGIDMVPGTEQQTPSP